MLAVETVAYSPNSTSFGVGAVEPEIKDGTLRVFTGEGQRRSSWGAPGVTSTVVLNTDDLIAVHIGWHHKYHGGQAWRYYRPAEQGWTVVQWPQLNDDDRERVLEAVKTAAPHWAKAPGKLKSERRPQERSGPRTTYKIVEIEPSGRFYSVYDQSTEYIIGAKMTERAVDSHGGGFYSYPDADQVMNLFNIGELFPDRCYSRAMRLALIMCEASGPYVAYDNGKLASTHLRPMQVLETFEHIPWQNEMEA